jgi:hypothetical protein
LEQGAINESGSTEDQKRLQELTQLQEQSAFIGLIQKLLLAVCLFVNSEIDNGLS